MAKGRARTNWFVLAAGIIAWVLGAIGLLGTIAPLRFMPGWTSLLLLLAGLALAMYGAIRERERRGTRG